MEIPIPKYFINEKIEALKEREKLLGQILTKIGPQDKDDVSKLACCSKIALSLNIEDPD